MKQKSNPKKIVFLDRDGVINIDHGYVSKKNSFKFQDFIFEFCRFVTSINFDLIIVTNQSGIGRGMYSEEEFNILNSWMLAEFKKQSVDILDVFYCPHHPDKGCECRKPAPGMFLNAIEKYNIDIDKSWMIGDKESDITASSLAGIENNIIVSNKDIDSSAKHTAKCIEDLKNIIKVYAV